MFKNGVSSTPYFLQCFSWIKFLPHQLVSNLLCFGFGNNYVSKFNKRKTKIKFVGKFRFTKVYCLQADK